MTNITYTHMLFMLTKFHMYLGLTCFADWSVELGLIQGKSTKTLLIQQSFMSPLKEGLSTRRIKAKPQHKRDKDSEGRLHDENGARRAHLAVGRPLRSPDQWVPPPGHRLRVLASYRDSYVGCIGFHINLRPNRPWTPI